MRAAWRLALAGLWARRVRTILLVGAVALSAALVAAVSCAMASANRGFHRQLEMQLGTADARLRPAGAGMLLPAEALARVQAWRGVARAVPIHEAAVSVAVHVPMLTDPDGDGVHSAEERLLGSSALLVGVPPTSPGRLDDLHLLAGRLPAADNEVVIDALLAERFTPAYALESGGGGSALPLRSGDASYLRHPPPTLPETAGAAQAGAINDAVGPRPGDTLRIVRLFRRPIELTVVGVSRPPPLGGRPRAYTGLGTVAAITNAFGQYTQIEIDLEPGVDPDAFVEIHAAELGRGAILTTTERVTTGVQRNLNANQIGFALASTLAFLCAAFIVMTGLTTGLGEQQRVLAVLRCIGATRAQLAAGQLVAGGVIGSLGAVVGVPLGVLLAWALTLYFRDRVPTGLAVSPGWLAAAAAGTVASGLLGAAWPAWVTSRISPLAGLANRARPATTRGILATTLAGLACMAVMAATVVVPEDGQVVFWGYAVAGLPAMFVGYFLLSVPVAAVVSRLLGPVLTLLLRLPRSVLARTIAATPYRHGFTAGAMMAGLALMVAVWTNGGAFLRDYLGRIRFPDAFVSGLALTPEAQATLENLPFVTETCAITLHPVETDAFGVRALQSYKTTFVAFEPEPFFRMASLEFVEGDARTAQRRLGEGGAVIVAREFRTAQGLGVGDTFTCHGADGVKHDFEIVGVVTSPGLELVSKFFNIGDEFVEQAVHAVFGSRRDMAQRWGVETIQLIQVGLDPAYDDAEAVAQMRRALWGAGVMDAGSGRRIKRELIAFVSTSLVVFSSVAVGSMLIACFGVANLVAAGIHARRFELGVLRAVGGSRGLLARLLAAEACLIAVTACVVGTAMGLQSAWAGRTLYAHLIGLDLRFSAPVGAIGAGWLTVLALTIGAAAPAALWLTKRTPRELLATGR